METDTLSATGINEESTETHTGTEQSPWIARTEEDARELLQSWECTDHGEMPRSTDAAASFFLPFLQARSGFNTPHVALWRDGGKPDGILVGRRSVGRPSLTLGPLNIPMPRLRTLDITYGGLEARSATTAAKQATYLRQLLAADDLDCISIHHLPEGTEIAKLLQSGLRWRGDGGPVFTGHWFSGLNDRDGQPVHANSSKTRRNFRRKDRKFDDTFNGEVEVRELRSTDEVETLLATAAGIGARSYQAGIGVGVRDNPRWRAILSILAASGDLRGYLLDAGGESVAYAVGSVCGDTCTLMATSFLPEHRQVAPGTYLVRRVIERLQQEQLRWLDFGFGEAPYKELHGTLHRRDMTLHLFANSRAARTARALDIGVKWVDRTARRLLESTGLQDTARRLRRRRGERRRS